jgi:glycyl-tRNA synthetase
VRVDPDMAALDPVVAPTLAAVLPVTADLADACRRAGLTVTTDDSGSIGRRYRRQDEVGTPYCVTLDHRTRSDDAVTIRERDSTDQVRVPADSLIGHLGALRDGRRSFADL